MSFFCNANGMTAEERARYDALMLSLDIKNRPRHELADGIAFELPPESAVIVKAAEWMCLERKCCPFFSFSLELDRTVRLSLHGEEGIKEFIGAEFSLEE